MYFLSHVAYERIHNINLKHINIDSTKQQIHKSTMSSKWRSSTVIINCKQAMVIQIVRSKKGITLAIRERFSSLVHTVFLWIFPSSYRQSCHNISKLGCTYQLFIVAKNVFHEDGRPSIAVWRISFSSTVTPILTSWSLTWEILVKNYCTDSSFSIFRF